MNENIGPALLVAGIGFIWSFPYIIDEELFNIKGRKSCLFEVLSFIIPVTPLITLPIIIILPSKREHPFRIDWLKLLLKSLLIAAGLSVFAGLVTFAAISLFT